MQYDQKYYDNKLRTEAISLVDELNQWLNGNVTDDSLRDALEDMRYAIDGIFVTKQITN